MGSWSLKRKIFSGLGTILLIAILFAWHELAAKKPFFINNFFNRPLITMIMDSAETKTQFGLPDLTGHNAKMDDYSKASGDELFELVHELKAGLALYDDEDLSKDELLSKRIMNWLLDVGIEGEKYRFVNYPMNPMGGAHTGVPSFLDTFHEVNDPGDAADYIARISQFGRIFSEEMENLELRQEMGIIPPTFIVERNLETMRGFIETAPEENILYTSLATKMDEAGEEFTEEEKAAFKAEVVTALNDIVYPAYETLIVHFEGLLPLSGQDAGYWRLPDGPEAYRLALKLFNTTDMTPDEIHAIGLAEVERIQGEILTILAEQGIDTSGGFTAAMDILKSDPNQFYEDSDEGREQMLAQYAVIIDEMYEGLDAAFSRLPEAGVEVRRIQEFQEATTPSHYNQPSFDGERPGIFYANLHDVKAEPKFGMRTLAYHEAVPGHHLQVALGMELEGLPLFRQMGPFSAFSEGWALYAEQLAWEMGYVTDPYDNVGRLQSELFRSVRLVVDTGLHAKQWTREQAIQYMMDNVGSAETEAQREIERYIVLPGQATSYKLGMIEILKLREEAKEALGDDFDIREFHAVILENGAMPLAILRDYVQDWIDSKTAA